MLRLVLAGFSESKRIYKAALHCKAFLLNNFG